MEKRAFVVALIAFGGTAVAAPVTPPNIADESSITSLEASLGGISLQPIDLSAQPISPTTGLNAQNNVLTSAFSAAPFYTGTLTSEVLSNVSAPGVAVTDVVIKYTFQNTGTSVQAIDTFNFGAGSTIDFADILNARQGRITSLTTHVPVPAVTVDNGANTTYDFDFVATSALAPGDQLVWYVAAGGDVRVNLVDVVVTDFSNATAKALIFTTTQGQDDLDVPTPGAAALAGLAFGAAGLRRRRR